MSIFPTRILLAIDGSEETTLAAQTAIDLANKTGSELHVVCATRPPPYSFALYEATRKALMQELTYKTKAKSTQGEDRVYSTRR